MPSKDHLIEAIREFNGTVRRDWLHQFDDASLRRYLDHLLHGQEPRGGESRWSIASSGKQLAALAGAVRESHADA